ncbi:hypothetical protein Pse7367_2089 [Thalassoporum mexicanum PCC 7367]|uniref:hypothetical protein n=1 Tax=Thalassoporum mexicanum TaxID=3457544 RepID=UPI00029FCAB6|nr:hypothetical protein [Pseudanabaena sp. PCC 7367]AFY70357.1 hypothetical protein Pse7367_2089 [Pseudanabaena sp. PCC 7367]
MGNTHSSQGHTSPDGDLVKESVPIFVPNQVLSSEDLNQLANHLRTQDQLTRTALLGVGILNGLQVSSLYFPATATEVAQAGVTVSSGAFVTVDGFYIPLGDLALTHYQLFSDASLFPTQPVLELFDTPNSDRLALHQNPDGTARNQTDFEDVLEDKLLVLHVELELRSRTALLSYDVVGKDEHILLRFFLIPRPSEVDLEAESYVVLKQRRMLHTFLTSDAPQLKRCGYVADDPPSVNLSKLRTYLDLQQNYDQICIDAIVNIEDSLRQVGALAATFPHISQAITALDPSLEPNSLFTGVSERLRQQLNEITSQPVSMVQPISLQYFYDYLRIIIAADQELADCITVIADYLPEVSRQRFLMLGSMLEVNRPETSPSLLATYRSDFVPVLKEPLIASQFVQVGYLFLRLVRLCEVGSFTLGLSSEGGIKLTPSADRTAPLSQQAIPYYVNYEKLHRYWSYNADYRGKSQALFTYHRSHPHSFLYQSTTGCFYRIEGHLGKTSHEVLSQIQADRDRYGLSFNIILLKLKIEELPETLPSLPHIENKHLFHYFAQIYPGMEPLGGVSKGGSFILVYVEAPADEPAQAVDAIVADFTLPYMIDADTLRLQAPRSFTITIPAAQQTEFRNNDDEEYEIMLIPDGGVAEGKGIVERSGKFYFQPSQLQSELEPQMKLDLTGRWGNHVKILAVTIFAPPLARFWLGNQVSGPDRQGNDIYIDLDPASQPLPLRPKILTGEFRAYQTSDEEKAVLTKLIDQNTQTFIPQNASGIGEVTIEYSLDANLWGEQTNSIIVRINAQETTEPSLNETDTNNDPVVQVIPFTRSNGLNPLDTPSDLPAPDPDTDITNISDPLTMDSAATAHGSTILSLTDNSSTSVTLGTPTSSSIQGASLVSNFLLSDRATEEDKSASFKQNVGTGEDDTLISTEVDINHEVKNNVTNMAELHVPKVGFWRGLLQMMTKPLW